VNNGATFWSPSEDSAGSLTVIATVVDGAEDDGAAERAVVTTESSLIALDPELAAAGVFPALRVSNSRVSNEDELRDANELDAIRRLRSLLADLDPAEAAKLVRERIEGSASNAELLSSLYLVQGIVERRTTIPILSNVLLQADGGSAMLAATDQEVGIRSRCAAVVKKKGSLTTAARKLYEMVREFPEGEVRIRSAENNWIEVSAGRSRFRLVGMDPREFPAMPEPPAAAKTTVRISAQVLSEMIEHTVFAVSGDETRANLNGVFMECVERGRLRMVATDGDHNTAGLKATAMRLVNAVPAVVAAKPGLLTALDLPLVTGRGLVS